MPFMAVHSPLLGREVQIRVEADPEAALAADAAAVAEFERLSQVFSIYSETSELSRWRRGEVEECSPELTQVLAAAKAWHTTSGGAFHPAIGALRLRWLRAAAEDKLPDPAELAELVEACAVLPFTIAEGRVRRIADCSGVDLNAIAKGYIVDRAAAAAMEVPGIDAVMINAAGDLRHLGDGSVLVGVQDAAGPLEPVQPRWRVRLARAGLSTSGAIRRGFEIAGDWLGHVLDPRTGWPVAHTSSASVVAADAMTADALVTVLGVLEPEAAIAYAQADEIGCLLLTADGRELRSPAWPDGVDPA